LAGLFHHSLFTGANDGKVDVMVIVTQGGARFTSLALGYHLSPFQGCGLRPHAFRKTAWSLALRIASAAVR
jgi:hypothetical protein